VTSRARRGVQQVRSIAIVAASVLASVVTTALVARARRRAAAVRCLTPR
jgi:hypothetical protein